MRILVGGKWTDGFPDFHRAPAECRVQVVAWKNLEPLDELYFAHPRSLRLIWNYVREVGALGVMRKVRSRLGERSRNEKYISLGLGRIVEASVSGRHRAGQAVVFVAPSHPPCVERIVLPEDLLDTFDEAALTALSPEAAILHLPADPAPGERWWAGLDGWSPYSGVPLSASLARDTLARAAETLAREEWSRARRLAVEGSAGTSEVLESPVAPASSERPSAVLFGYGHYAKNVALPNVRPFLAVERIHEVDPTQISRNDRSVNWDTAPTLRDGHRFGAVLIAGYHHTHAPLAVEALRRGAYAVVEKPVVVDATQLAELLEAVERTPLLFSCFHKRYLPFNALALEDLGVTPGEPVSYHCIVYEVPLPRLHWYRWPNSRSRLTSNGCHWLDHFLFLNEFSPVAAFDLAVAPDETLNCSVTLRNGAFFTMVLTDQGSARIGVQDYIELRANGTTVRMVNGGEYVAEGRDRVLRRRRINKLHSYERMYREIGRKIAEGRPGDSRRSLEVSTGLVLALEERLRQLTVGTTASRNPAAWSAIPDRMVS
jgi:predicted dehydrogenase